jgi:hypothetical protein
MYSFNNNLDNIYNIENISYKENINENIDENINENINEKFGNLQDYPQEYEDSQKKLIYDINNLDTGINIINSKSQIDFLHHLVQNPHFPQNLLHYLFHYFP